MVQQPDSQVALQQPYCFVYGSMMHGMPGPQQSPLHGVSPIGPAIAERTQQSRPTTAHSSMSSSTTSYQWIMSGQSDLLCEQTTHHASIDHRLTARKPQTFHKTFVPCKKARLCVSGREESAQQALVAFGCAMSVLHVEPIGQQSPPHEFSEP